MLDQRLEAGPLPAATAVVTTRSMLNPGQRIAFDRPFVFALRDRTSGLVLLSDLVPKFVVYGRSARQLAPASVVMNTPCSGIPA